MLGTFTMYNCHYKEPANIKPKTLNNIEHKFKPDTLEAGSFARLACTKMHQAPIKYKKSTLNREF